MRNSNIACPKCRKGRSGYGASICARCGVPEIDFGPRVSIPKKNNHKAWETILSGDIYWDKKKVAKNPHRHMWRKWARSTLKEEMAKRLLERWS